MHLFRFNLIFAIFPIIWVAVVIFIVSKILTAAAQQNKAKKNIQQDIRHISEYIIEKTEDMRGSSSGSVRSGHSENRTSGPQSYVHASSQPHYRKEKTIHEKLNGEDQPKRGKLSRESRDDEKDWF